MTAGYGAGDAVPGRGEDETVDHGPGDSSPAGRPGPLPPRIARPAGHASVPGQPGLPAPGGASPAAGGVPPRSPEDLQAPPTAGGPTEAAVPAPRTTWSPTPNTGQWGGPGGT
ncbi:hypothetical protein ACWEVO_29130, partial [Micromonospora sp. NPDC003776]